MELSPIAARVFATVLAQRTGQQLAPNRQWRIGATLQEMMRAEGLDSLDQVAARLAGARDPMLAEQVIDALLNNETSFFRDPAMFRLLIDEALPTLMPARRARQLRLWSAGCSTGQEVYSLAIAFADDPRWRDWSVAIVASDVSRAAVSRAREGVYDQREIQRGLPARTMLDWFAPEADGRWRAAPALRARMLFLTQNLLDPPPPGRFDAILCRNVLLYLDAPTRRRVLDMLAGALAPDGMLMLGAGETVIGQSGRLAADPVHRGLYRRVLG